MDLRERVLAAWEAGEGTQAELARRYRVVVARIVHAERRRVGNRIAITEHRASAGNFNRIVKPEGCHRLVLMLPSGWRYLVPEGRASYSA